MSYFDNCSIQIIKVNMGTIGGLGGKSAVIGFGFVKMPKDGVSRNCLQKGDVMCRFLFLQNIKERPEIREN